MRKLILKAHENTFDHATSYAYIGYTKNMLRYILRNMRKVRDLEYELHEPSISMHLHAGGETSVSSKILVGMNYLVMSGTRQGAQRIGGLPLKHLQNRRIAAYALKLKPW